MADKKTDIALGIVRTMAKEVREIETYPGWKHDFFQSFEELDAQFKIWFGPQWREEEWAKFWLRNHWNFETSEYRRHAIHRDGKKFRTRTPGSVRDKREKEGPKQLHRVTPNHVLVGFIDNLKTQNITSLRKVAEAIEREYGISLSHQTIRRIKKKYNI